MAVWEVTDVFTAGITVMASCVYIPKPIELQKLNI